MTNIQDIPSGVSTNDSTADDKYRNTSVAIGHVEDAAADGSSGNRSAVELMKGIVSGLGTAAGSGDAAVNGNPNILDDGLAAMGTQQDDPATDTGVWSAVSLAKGILQSAGI